MVSTRGQAAAWVSETLSRRAGLLGRVSSGTLDLADAFSACDEDDRLVGLKTLALVEACPGRKKVQTRREFARLGIDESAVVGEVDAEKREALAAPGSGHLSS